MTVKKGAESNNDNLFAGNNIELQEQEQHGQGKAKNPWKILIVDDEKDIHTITRLTLGGFNYKGKPLSFLSAYSAKEAEELMIQHPDIALILLDVVMEEDDTGFKFAKFVRETLKNPLVRIILRTGQAGITPHASAISYDIDNYQEKTELTKEKFLYGIMGALQSYQMVKRHGSKREKLGNNDKALQALLAEYAKNLPDKVGFIERGWQELRTAWNADNLRKFYKDVHNFCGTTGSYGFKKLSIVARDLEIYLKSLMEKNSAVTPEEEEKINRLVGKLKTHLPQKSR